LNGGEIALFSMRDKVVQASIANELGQLVEPLLSGSVYSYREGKSALLAISDVEEAIRTTQYRYVLKTDIESFFDRIDHNILKNKLFQLIRELDSVDLIMSQLRSPCLLRNGDLGEKTEGIYQGASQ